MLGLIVGVVIALTLLAGSGIKAIDGQSSMGQCGPHEDPARDLCYRTPAPTG